MKFIINFLFRRLTVDSIVASFDKTIAKLDTVQKRQTVKVEQQTDKIKRAAEKRTKHADEATRAAQTAERFKRLVRGDEPKDETAADDFHLGEARIVNASIRTSDSGTITGFGLDAPSLQVSPA